MDHQWGTNPALLVVDVSRRLADPSLETAVPDIVRATDHIAELLAVARANDVPRLFTNGGKKFYTSGGADLADDERGPWPMTAPIRDESREEALSALELAPQLDRRDDEPLITKRTPSAFFDSPLADQLEARGVDTLVITGIVTSCCVRATVQDAFAHEYPIVLPRECIADRRPAAHGFHLEEMGDKFADLATTADVMDYLESVA